MSSAYEDNFFIVGGVSHFIWYLCLVFLCIYFVCPINCVLYFFLRIFEIVAPFFNLQIF